METISGIFQVGLPSSVSQILTSIAMGYVFYILDPFGEGAKAAGLKPEYVEKLRRIPTYSPPGHILKMREARGDLSDHPEITMDELAKHKSDDNKL